ncbi:protein-disulfide reductase DsbD domain-containing protein [Pelomonas sp. SE-A7]|uniref:protein-disulfide reductase DsbD family protein n=1 Tax=Pelomonas sp. SE-A7 TaxID=3054953 RepID=UPI00259CA65A|nr:protein-disulfide reductase DsbD domain-containing protein [Pelomonas sp. SE-A7]MDM4764756.1 protein-disulfide reductase DsbD family protein [Pelomonas sp. SE-A7]
MSRFPFFLSLVLLGSALAATASQAQIFAADQARTPQVEVRLLSDSASVQPGQRLVLALEQRIAPHWHTYWSNPGDSGQPTAIAWKLPAGATAGPILWPTPERIDIGPLANYGYSTQVLLLSEIQLPKDLQPGRDLAFEAAVTWLVCKDICLPQEAKLSLHLPVAAKAQASVQADSLKAARTALPGKAPWPVQAQRDPQGKLLLSWPAKGEAPGQAQFFAAQWGPVRHAEVQTLSREGQQWQLSLAPGESPLAAGQKLQGLLVLGEGADRKAYQVDLPLRAASAEGSTSNGEVVALLPALLLALVGGLVLNLMPCVFPVLSIKAFSLVQQAHGHADEARRHGVAYTLGVLASFAVLGAVLLLLRGAGAEIGWGLQFQSPLFVLGVAWLLFGLGLSLSGLLEVGAGLGGVGSSLAEKRGLAGSFFSGVLAAVVATPCTAPFMGAAVAYALQQPGPQLLAVFLSLGLGLALPYLLLSWWPALQRLMPRPGAWMNVLKQGLAFPMYGAAIWLVWVLALQGGAQAVLIALCGMALIALAAWLRQVSRHARSAPWRRLGLASALGALMAALMLGAGLPVAAPQSAAAGVAEAGFEPYTPERLTELRAEGKPVFVNLTAAWCISCLVNEKVALSRPEVKAAFAERGIHYLKGDWTHQDPRISALLAEHGRSGVPLYLYYPSGAEPRILPQLLTPGLVLDELRADKKT